MKWFARKFLRALAWMMYIMPGWIRSSLGMAIGWLWFDVFRIRRQVAIQNLSLAFPDLTSRDLIRLARASCVHLGLTLTDFCLFPFLTREGVSRFVRIEGRENVDRVLAQGHGALVLACHLGNGDLASAAASLNGMPINMISKKFRSEWLNELWFGMRQRLGTKFISFEKSSFDILRALRDNQMVIFVLDQYMGPPSGIACQFFGHEAGTAAGLALFQDRTRLPVIPAYCYRESHQKSVLVFDTPIEFQPIGDRSENIARMTQIYNDKIEEVVREHPEQWMWIHRRWKKFE